MKHTIVIALAATLCAPFANAQNLFTNGSMSGSVGASAVPPGWAPAGGSADISDPSGPWSWIGSPTISPDGGTWLSALGFTILGEAARQTVTGLTVGETYEFSYYFANHHSTGESASGQQFTDPYVTISGMSGYSNPGGPGLFNVWNHHTFQLTATSTSATFTLEARSQSGSGFAAFDGLSLVHVPTVPEPSGALLLGLGGSLAVLRRRR